MERDRSPRIEVCSDCDGLSRRGFLRSVGAAAAATSALGLPARALASFPALEDAKPAAGSDKPAETVVKALYDSLTDEQRDIVCMPFDHPKRSMVKNNWHIVDQGAGAIGKLYTPDQQEMIRQIFRGVTSPEGYERFLKQMKDDDGGIERYTCAIFGKPGEDAFEWVMTGRHLTIRADGNSVDNAAFGGPIFYGHAVEFNEKPDHPGNVWWHQARLANKVYAALDGKQRDKALVVESPPDSEKAIVLKGKDLEPEGIAVADLSADQKALVKETIGSMLSMYRKSDVDEAIACIEKNGGLDALRMSFFQEGDIGDDEVWDRWRVEGPALVWYFRGSPHVHTWVHIAHEGGRKAETKSA